MPTAPNTAPAAFAAELATIRKQLSENTDRLTVAERHIQSGRRKLKVTWAVASLATLVALTIGWHKDAIAQGYGMTLAQAATRISALETKTQDISRVTDANTSKTTVRFSGVNVQIVDGSGRTEGTQNGLGNLIIGYNETKTSLGIYFLSDPRNGNHNLITGIANSYSGNGGVVFGYGNTVSSVEASVLGGVYNTASNNQASVSGGYGNTASGLQSSVSGGNGNTASSNQASVSGGNGNAASGPASSISGGRYNTASGSYSSVSGGGTDDPTVNPTTSSLPSGNAASGDYSSVSGGYFNVASGRYSSISGGFNGETAGDYASILGGRNNRSNGQYGCVSGGSNNRAGGLFASVSGGYFNVASGAGSSVSGGLGVQLTDADYFWGAGGSYTAVNARGAGAFHSP